jgi:hypothetical protein
MNQANGTEMFTPVSARCPRDGLDVGFNFCFNSDVFFGRFFVDFWLFLLPFGRRLGSVAKQPGCERIKVREIQPLARVRI